MPLPPRQAISRIKKNTAYFKVNYSVAVLATCMVTFLMNPSSLLVLGVLVAAWAYFIFVKQGPLVISGRQIRWGTAGTQRAPPRRPAGRVDRRPAPRAR